MSPVLSREERDAIRARAEAATDGPWTAHNMERAGWLIETPESREAGEYPAAEVREGRDAQFIAHARSDVPALLDALDAAEEENERLRGALHESQQAANALRAKVDRQAWSLRRAAEHRRQGDAAHDREAALRDAVRALIDRDRDGVGGVRLPQHVSVADLRAVLAAPTGTETGT